MKLTVIAKGHCSQVYPEIKIFENSQCIGHHVVQDLCEMDVEIQLSQPNNMITIEYFNKLESHTRVENSVIVQDQYVELIDLRVDDILLDRWMLTESDYQPAYFDGFRLTNPTAPVTIRSQLIWHFPGQLILQSLPPADVFWEWYYHQRRNVYVDFLDGKDQQRNEQYAGSTELYAELIQEIKDLINV